MIIIPRENPVFKNLNSFYLNVENFIEHFKNEIETGCLHFKSYGNEGVIFFGEDNFLSGIIKTKKGTITGDKAVDIIKTASPKSNFNVSVYKIAPGRVYYWANLSNAKEMYKGLSSEFTDLEGLIKKMSTEKLTGYIDAKINKTNEQGLVYFLSGEIIGGFFSWESHELKRVKEHREQLIQKSRDNGGMFNVMEIPVQTNIPAKKVAKKIKPVPATESKNEKPPKQKDAPVKKEKKSPKDVSVLEIIQKLLNITENTVKTNKKSKTAFDILLRKKFVSKVAEFEFLDPFSAEFQYVDNKVTYTGHSSDEELINGITTCIKELAREENIVDSLISNLGIWLENYDDELKKYNINFEE